MSRLAAPWHKLPVSLKELCIDTTLRCGQSFRWRKFDDEWRCSLYGRILSLKQDAECLYYKATFPDKAAVAASQGALSSRSDDAVDHDDTETLLRGYFHLQLDLGALYDQWSRDDANFRKKAPQFSGIRILNQDAWEALICFICSSNNNISRISQMAHKLCVHYGPLLGSVDGEAFHDFPSPAALAAPSVEAHLRQLGFGYRAKYIAQTARTLCSDKPEGWLEQLRNPACPAPGQTEPVKAVDADCTPSYKTAHEQLLLLSGVGPKVADCVALMGLGWGEAVPVDTHVWQIAVRDYKFKRIASKTFSRAVHDAVGDHFRGLWGPYAGWAQSVLFTANLKSFSEQLKGAAGSDESKSLKTGVELEIKEEEDVQTTEAAVTKSKRKTVVKVEEDAKVVTVRETQTRSKRSRR
ncbi:8-oxoguanine glycosylase ogg1 [Sporothrix curviconia]|uniref:DNA-(apurinic or apyrimidinic site) lyase n=1 Tax=Sporothrix curviconia TaxID=1260050 RepID=A0ABP0B4R8_9PEZI